MKISVVVCTYNGKDFIIDQLESILNQTIKVDEIIICDDQSNDGTYNILKLYKSRFPELFKVFINKKRLGVVKNFEKAISIAKGELIFLSDQDDIWEVRKVEVIKNFFFENINCKLVFTNGILINKNNSIIGSTLWEEWKFTDELRNKWKKNFDNAFKDLILNRNKITGATVCFHQSLKKNAIPVKIPQGYWHDSWLGMHAAAQEGLFFIETCLIKYRIHENQQVGVGQNINPNETFSNYHIDRKLFLNNLIEIYPKKIKIINSVLSNNTSNKNLLYKIVRKIKNFLN